MQGVIRAVSRVRFWTLFALVVVLVSVVRDCGGAWTGGETRRVASVERRFREADERLDDNMLLSWYDRDRDFESPQHASECHSNSPIPGYVDYALYRNASLKIDIEGGRFVFFYLPLDF